MSETGQIVTQFNSCIATGMGNTALAYTHFPVGLDVCLLLTKLCRRRGIAVGIVSALWVGQPRNLGSISGWSERYFSSSERLNHLWGVRMGAKLISMMIFVNVEMNLSCSVKSGNFLTSWKTLLKLSKKAPSAFLSEVVAGFRSSFLHRWKMILVFIIFSHCTTSSVKSLKDLIVSVFYNVCT